MTDFSCSTAILPSTSTIISEWHFHYSERRKMNVTCQRLVNCVARCMLLGRSLDIYEHNCFLWCLPSFTDQYRSYGKRIIECRYLPPKSDNEPTAWFLLSICLAQMNRYFLFNCMLLCEHSTSFTSFICFCRLMARISRTERRQWFYFPVTNVGKLSFW